MKIIHVYDGHEAVYQGEGSVPDVVWNLAKKSADSGHDVTVIERQWDKLKKAELRNGVSFTRLNLGTGADTPWERIPYKMVNSITGAAKLIGDRLNFAINTVIELRKTEFDVIHFHLPFASNFIILLAPWLRKKSIYTSHIGETKKRIIEPTFSPDVFLSKRVGKTVALNPEMSSAYVDSGVSRRNICVIPNGTDTTRFQNVPENDVDNVENKYGLGSGITVLFVGSVTPRKGVIDLINSAERVTSHEKLESNVEVNFIITGKTSLDENYAQEVRNKVREMNLGQEVQITGYVPYSELLALYDTADIFILPSYEEGSSVAISEAISSKTPIIASDIGGNAQQIDHGVHGFLVKPGDVDGFADKIRELAMNNNLRTEIIYNLQERANKHSWSNIAKRYHEQYEHIRDYS